jgi:hypothetical protein
MGQSDLKLDGKWFSYSSKTKASLRKEKCIFLCYLLFIGIYFHMAVMVFTVTLLLLLLSMNLNMYLPERYDILLNQNTYAQLGVSPGEILLNKTNATSNSTEENNITTVTPIATAPGVNLSVENIMENNKTGEAEPVGGIK